MMALSGKFKEPTTMLPLGLELELDGPPVDPHEVITRARATMLAPSTKICFNRIAFHLRKK